MNKNKGIIYVLIGAASFGFTPIFAKLAFNLNYTLGQLNIAQMIISCLILWSLVLIKRPTLKGLSKINIIKIMITGTSVGLTTVFYYASMQYLPASLAIILLFQFVWIVILFEWIFNKTKPSKASMISIILILAGVLFASDILYGSIQGFPLIGFVFGILSAFTYAGFIFFSGKVATHVDPWVRSSFMVTGSLILVLLIFIKDIPSVPPVNDSLWLIALGVALFGAVLPPLFYALGAYRITAGLANILTSVELPVSIILASIILSESINLMQWLGVLLIISSIIMNEIGFPLRRFSKRETEIHEKRSAS